MGIINRDLSTSEKQTVYTESLGLVATGATIPLMVVPYYSVLTGGAIGVFGLSGSPQYSLYMTRFIVGTGVTVMTLAPAITPLTFGTSGYMSFGVTSGITLQPGDLIGVVSSVSNTASYVTVSLVVKAIEDIRKNITTV